MHSNAALGRKTSHCNWSLGGARVLIQNEGWQCPRRLEKDLRAVGEHKHRRNPPGGGGAEKCVVWPKKQAICFSELKR